MKLLPLVITAILFSPLTNAEIRDLKEYRTEAASILYKLQNKEDKNIESHW